MNVLRKNLLLGLAVIVTAALSLDVLAQNVDENVEFITGRSSGSVNEKKMKKAPKRVYIKEFSVSYQLIYMDQDQTREGVYHGSTKSSLTVGFEDVKLEDLQANTDALYKNFVDKLTASGFELVSADEAAQTKLLEGYTKVEGGQISRAQAYGYAYTTPNGYDYLVKKINSDGKQKANVFLNPGKLSNQLDEAVVVSVVMNIPFMIEAESTGSKLLKDAVGGVSKVVAKPYLRIASGSSAITYNYGYEAGLNHKLDKNINIEGVFEDEKFKASAAAKQNSSYKMGYHTMVVSEKATAENIQVAKCDADKYVKGVTKATSLYLNKSVDDFLMYANDK